MSSNRALTSIQDVTKDIASRSKQFASVLPSHITVERFQRTAVTAIQNNPDLLDVRDRQSLFTALTRAAYDGLLPDGREGALVIMSSKGVKYVQWMPMIAGILKKVRQSGEIANWTAHAVYEKDDFEVLYGDDDRIYHKPYNGADRTDKITGAYSIVTFKDGTKSRDYMPWWRIEKARAVSKAANSEWGPWKRWPDEMAVKTVMKHHAKTLPQSTDIDGLILQDEATQTEFQAAPVQSGVAALEQSITHDAETGEIIEVQTLEAETVVPEPEEAQLEPWQGKYDAAQAAFAHAANVIDLNTAYANYQPDIEAMPEATAKELQAAYTARLNELKAKN